MDGLVLIDKKENVTSYDVIRLVKKIFKTRKVGHCGTLDPFASGLLIVGVNQATKVMTFLEHDYKEYEATIQFGIATDTYDTEGKTVETKDVIYHDDGKIIDVLNSFLGEITQTPPVFSSIHVDGKKLYEYARENKEVEVPSRKVFIHDIKLLKNNKDNIKIYVKCSRGTYIRSLGVDIAKQLDNVGHLNQLRRISIGGINVNSAISYEDLENENVELIPIKDALVYKKLVISDASILKRVYNGQDVILKNETEDKLIIIDNDKEIAIYERKEAVFFHCVRGLFDENIRLERLKELKG